MIRYHISTSEGPQWFIEIPGKRHAYVTLSHMLKYNPQRLLTDQRGPSAKLLGMSDEQMEEWTRLSLNYHKGGIIGRGMKVPYLFPGTKLDFSRPEAVIPFDYSQVESRVARTPKKPTVYMHTVGTKKFVETLKAYGKSAERMARQMELLSGLMQQNIDQSILRGVYGPDWKDPAEKTFARERRIYKLMYSKDKRQRKRGERLFKAWRLARLATRRKLWVVDEIDDYYRDDNAADLRRFYNTQLGEPYDPSRYRKD